MSYHAGQWDDAVRLSHGVGRVPRTLLLAVPRLSLLSYYILKRAYSPGYVGNIVSRSRGLVYGNGVGHGPCRPVFTVDCGKAL